MQSHGYSNNKDISQLCVHSEHAHMVNIVHHIEGRTHPPSDKSLALQMMGTAPRVDSALPISPLDPRHGNVKQEHARELQSVRSSGEADYQVGPSLASLHMWMLAFLYSTFCRISIQQACVPSLLQRIFHYLPRSASCLLLPSASFCLLPPASFCLLPPSASCLLLPSASSCLLLPPSAFCSAPFAFCTAPSAFCGPPFAFCTAISAVCTATSASCKSHLQLIHTGC